MFGRGCGRLMAAGIDLVELDHQGCRPRLVHRVFVARGAHQIGQNVGCAQQQVQNRRPRRQLAGTHLVQAGFEHMGKAHQRVQGENPGPAFDGMHRPENGIDGLGLGRAAFHQNQPGLQLGQLLFAFLEKGLANGFHRIHGHKLLRFKPIRGEWRRPASPDQKV